MRSSVFSFFFLESKGYTVTSCLVMQYNNTRTHKNSREPSRPELGVCCSGESATTLADAHASMEHHPSRHACSTRRCMRRISSRQLAVAKWLTNALVSADHRPPISPARTTSSARPPGRNNSGEVRSLRRLAATRGSLAFPSACLSETLAVHVDRNLAKSRTVRTGKKSNPDSPFRQLFLDLEFSREGRRRFLDCTPDNFLNKKSHDTVLHFHCHAALKCFLPFVISYVSYQRVDVACDVTLN